MNGYLLGRYLPWLTALLPPLLQLWPLPPELLAWRPVFPVVFVAFWAYIYPSIVGGGYSFLYGLVIELMAGVALGLYSIPCAIVALGVGVHYLKFRAFPPYQQALLLWLFCLVGFSISYGLAYWRWQVDLLGLVVAASLSTAITWLLCRYGFVKLAMRGIKHHV